MAEERQRQLEADVELLAYLVSELAETVSIVAGTALPNTGVWQELHPRIERLRTRSLSFVEALKSRPKS